MNLLIVLFLANICTLIGVAVYFTKQREKLMEEEAAWLDRRKILDQEVKEEKVELTEISKEIKNCGS